MIVLYKQVMGLVRSSLAFRAVSLLTCTSFAYSACASGVNAVVAGSVKGIARAVRTAKQYSVSPSSAYLGANPGRSPEMRGVWDHETLLATRLLDPSILVAGQTQTGGTSHPVSVGSGSGSGYNWEGSTVSVSGVGSINTGNGDKLTTLHLLDWAVKGGEKLDFTLYHNSKDIADSEFGYGWSWTYNVYINSLSSNPIVHWGDGTCIPYTSSSTGGGSGPGIGWSSPFLNILNFTVPTYTAPAGIYDQLVQNTDGTWKVTKKDGRTFSFDTSGFLTQTADRNGYAISLTRNSQHYVTHIADPTGRYVDLTLNSSNQVQSIADHTGRSWSFSYDTNHDLRTVGWPSLGDGYSYTDAYAYDSAHRIATHTDRRGKSWATTYNEDGSIASESDPLGHATTYTYTSSYTQVTDPLGHSHRDNYSSGMLASQVDENGFSESFTARNTNKEVTTQVDKNGKTWTATYDANGNVLTQTDPLSHTTTYTYNGFSQVLTVTDPLNHTVTATYDGAGNLLTVVNSLGKTLATDVYSSGLLSSSTNALGKTTTITYDSNGLPSTVTNPLGNMSTYTFDSLSRVTSVTDALGHGESLSYDAWGRPNLQTHPGGSTVSIAYNGTDDITTVTDELAHSTVYSYDDAGRLLTKTNARGDQEVYAYDNANRAISVTNGRSKTRSYGYTSRGDVYTLTYPDGTVETWTHDGEGHVTAYTNGQNETTTYGYDDAGRNTGKDYPTGTDVTVSYDSADRMIQMADASGTTTWSYDAANQVLSEATPQVTANYTYDDAGQRLTREEVGTGTWTTTYDDAGRATAVNNSYNENSSDVYDAANRLVRRNFATGAYDEYAFDSRNRVTGIARKNSGGTTYSSESYVYDAANNLTSKTVDGVTTTFTYDSIDQLTGESKTGYSAGYTYDGNGNRLTKTLNGSTETYSYDDGDKLLSITGGSNPRTFTYDGCGRTLTSTGSGGTTTYSWDYEDKMVGVSYPNSTSTSAVYNGFGTRDRVTDQWGTLTFKRDGVAVDSPLTYDVTARFTGNTSFHSASTLKELHQDYLGSNVLVTDASQNVLLARTFDAFGNRLSTSSNTTLYADWNGSWGYYRQRDNALMLVGHRFYDPSTGRFLTRDRAMDSRNWYGYCDSNPLKRIDPSGLYWLYDRTTGEITHVTVVPYHLGPILIKEPIGTGYSGYPPYVNDPSHDHVKAPGGHKGPAGPLPGGWYTIGKPFNSPRTGRYVMRLIPDDDTDMFGRGDIEMHGDNSRHNHTASTGCLVAPFKQRYRIGTSGDDRLYAK